MNKIHISPAEFVSMTYDIFLQIKVDKQNFKSVVSIANGGIPLGEKLSEMLHLPYTSLKISTYDEANFKVYCSPIVEGDAPSDYFLLVDDIVDSGHTIKYLSEKLYFMIRKIRGSHFPTTPMNEENLQKNLINGLVGVINYKIVTLINYLFLII